MTALRILFTGILSCVVLTIHAAPAQAIDRNVLSTQQKTFLAAEHALKQGKRMLFQRLKAKLHDYPLYPYLRYAELRRYISRMPAKDMKAFIQEYAGSPLAQRLQRNWLDNLARHHQWQAFVENYQPVGSTTLQCRLHFAQLKLGQTGKAFQGAQKMWLSGNSRPKACDPLFAAWHKAGQMTPALVWRRIELAMGRNQAKLALYLSRFLPMAEQKWARLWYHIHYRPSGLLKNRALKKDTPRTRQIVLHGLRRMAMRDADSALRAWNTLQESYAFNNAQLIKAEYSIGLNLAIQAHPLALIWITSSRLENHTDHKLRAWSIRAAMRLGAWETAIAWIETLPEDEKKAEVWRYWYARALEMSGETKMARDIYSGLSRSRSYYGFLAADQLGSAYHFSDHPIDITPVAGQQLRAIPAIRRARELFQMGRLVAARREWISAAGYMNAQQLERAAKLAQEWGWYDRGIATAALARSWDDLELRFPVAYRQTILNNATKNDLELSWVYAVIRQESAFTKDARSPAGALGLMQLMPNTARQLARHSKARRHIQRLLLAPEANIRFGTAYLRMMLDRMEEHPVLATAAYNAGPRRVKGWLPDNKAMPADLWIETIPFSETRLYLKSVLAYTVIYEQRLGLSPSLQARMQPVGTPAQLAVRQDMRKPG